MSSQVADVPNSTAQWLQRIWHELKELPAPGEEWRLRDTDLDITSNRLRQLNRNGIINAVDRVYQSPGGPVNVYKTTPQGFQAVQRLIKANEETDGFLPCNDDCFINHGDGYDRPLTVTVGSEVLECKRCGKFHEKSEVRE